MRKELNLKTIKEGLKHYKKGSVEGTEFRDVCIIAENLVKELEEVKKMNVIQCCKSDSEQLVLFADWLQYNGKWSSTEQQVKDFLKEQQEQN